MRIGLLKAHEQNLILLYPALASARNPPVSIGTLPSAEIRYSCENPVVVQFPCHPEQAFFAQRRIWASRAKRRVSCGAIIARLARFLTDRKSTRLNSSHTVISYAVFCLKKKKI